MIQLFWKMTAGALFGRGERRKTRKLATGARAAVAALTCVFMSNTALATTFTETVPNGNGAIPNTYPPVGGTMFVLIGQNGNIYYQFVNPSTQFEGFQNTGTPTAFQGSPTFQLGPTQTLNCGTISCTDYFGGSIVEGYVRLTARDGDSCPGNFDYQDLTFNVNGIAVSSFSDLPASSVERTNFAGDTSLGFENCFRNQGTTETNTGWFDLTSNATLLANILSTGGTTPTITDTDPDDNRWFFTDGNDATGSPEVAPGITIEKSADKSSYSTVGEVVTYSFLVTNVGSVTVNNIVVTDSFITGTISCPQTSLVTGEFMTCTATHTISQQNIDDAATFVNTAEVNGNPTEGQLTEQSGELTITGPPANNTGTLTKTADVDTNLVLNDVVTYSYLVENTGNITWDNVTIADTHNGTGSLSAISPAPLTLSPGQSQTFTATYTITQADVDAGVPITNAAQITNTPKRGTFTSPTANESVSTTGTDSLDIVKGAPTLNNDADSSGDITAGDTLEYTVTVTNDGTKTLNNVIVSDTNLTPGSNTCASVAPAGTCVLTGTHIVSQAEANAGTVSNTASVTSTEVPGPTPSNTVNTPVEQDPALTNVKAVPTLNTDADSSGDITAGDTLEYVVTVTNTGNITLNNIVVSDTQLTPSSNSCATVAPGGTCVLTGTHLVSQAEADAGTIANTASVTSTEVPGPTPSNTVNTTVEQNSSLTNVKANPSLNTDADSSGDITAGDTLEYVVTVTNTGNVSLTNVVVSDSQLTPSSNTCASVAPGATCVLTGTHIVSQSEANAGTIANTASVTSTEVPGPTPSNTVNTAVEQDAALTNVKSSPTLSTDADSSGDITAGDTIQYVVTVTNTGNITLNNIVVSDSQLTPGSNTCASVAPGNTCVLTGTHLVTQTEANAGTIVNTASATSTEVPGPTPSNTVNTTVEQDPALTNVKANPTLTNDADSSGDITEGDTLEYVVTVTNTGNVTLNNVIVSDSQLTPSSNSCATVAVGGTCILTGTHLVTQAEADAGTIANTASATSTEVAGPTPSNTVNTAVEQDASLTNVKATPTLTTDADSSGDVTAGDTLTYVVTVTNTGNITLNNVVVSDAQLTPSSNTCASVAPGATCALTGTHIVSQTEADAGTIANTASATSTEVSGPTPSNTVNTTVEQDSSLTNVKGTPTLTTDADSSGDITAGDTIEYVVTVTNTGNITLNNVVVSDSQLTPSSNTCASVVPGSTCILTGSHLVTQAEADAGTIANTASATSTEVAGPTPSNTVNTPVGQDAALTNVKGTPTLTTDADSSGDITAGDTLTYVVTVTNTGNVTLNNVVVSDAQLTPSSNTCASVAPGATCALTGTHVVSQTEADAGTISNTASATSTEVPGPTPSNTVNTPVGQDAALTNVKGTPTLTTDADSSGDITAGDTIEYVVTVTNTGNVSLNNVVVSDSQLTPSSNTCASVAPAATCLLTGTHVVSQAEANAGTIANTASVTSTEVPGPTPSNTVNTTVEQDPAMTNVKGAPTLTTDADSSGDITAGDTIEYVVTVTNTGNITLNNVVVSDTQLTPSSNSCASVVPGSTCVLTGSHLVSQAEADAGTISNTASATSTEVPGPTPSNTVNTPIGQDAALTNVKGTPTLTTDADSSGDITAGDTIEYVVTVTNTGNVTLNNIVVSDTQLTPSSNSCATVAVGGTCVLTGTHVVSQAEANAGTIANTASTTSTEVPGPTPSNTVNTTVEQDPAMTNVKGTPTLTTDADSSGDITAGDTIEYVVTVTNTGNITLNNVVVSDTQLTPSSNSCAAVAPGATCILTGTHLVSQSEADAGTISNTASATSTEVPGPTPSNTVNTPVAQDAAITNVKGTPTLTTDADSSGDITAGDTIEYVVTVTNTGNITLNNIVVSDTQLTPSSNSCATVAVGGTCILTGTHLVTQAEADAGNIANTASATSTEVAGPTPSNTVNTPVGQDAELTIVKTALDTSFVAVGDTINYEYLVTNSGNVSISDLSVSDDKILTPNMVSCPVAALMPTENTTCTATYTVTQADLDMGFITNIAEATGTPSGGTLAPASATETVNGDQTSAMDFVKTIVDQQFSMPGDVTTYEYVVTNSGNVTLVDQITVSDNRIASVNCPGIPTGGLLPGDTLTCTASYTVTQADLDSGSVTNIATATSGTTTSPVASATTPANQNPALTLVKAAQFNNYANAGEVVTYEFTVTNSGNLSISEDISVTDDKIGTFTCHTGTLAPSDSHMCTADYTITQADIDTGSVTNQAYAESGALVSPPVTVTVSGTQTSVMTFDKRAVTTSFTQDGEVLNYEFDVTNSGNVTLSNIMLTDSLTTVSCPTNSLLPTATMTCTASYTVTQADVDAGEVINNASATATIPGGSTIEEIDSVTVSGNGTPSLTFAKTAIDTSYAAVGDVLNYEFPIENTGPITLFNISISDSLTTANCPMTSLAPMESMVCTASYSVIQADIDAGSVTNNASVSSELPGGTAGPGGTDSAIVGGNANPQMTIVKAAIETDYASVGNILNYTYDVTNSGNVTINSVSVTDDLIPTVNCPSTILAPMATMQCSGQYTITQADIDAGSVTNIASAVGAPEQGVLTPPTDSVTVNAAQMESLGIDKVATSADYNSVGDILTYDYIVTNTGNVTVTNAISVTDDRIATVNCPALPVGGLAPNAAITCTASYIVNQADIDAGSVTNIASATSGIVTSPVDSETVNAVQGPALSVVKTATDPTYAAIGDTIAYNYQVFNAGNTTITSAITVTDDKIATVNCPALPVGGLVPGASLTCTATYTVNQADIDAGSVTNIASATDGNVTSPNATESVPATQSPAMETVKTATNINFTLPGDITSYEYVVTNTGNTSITTPISVSDNLIPTVNCPALPIGGLAPGSSITCTADYTVTQADLDRGSVTNLASATSGGVSSPPTSETIPANATSALSVIKSSTDTTYAAVGDILTYSYEIENNGNLTLTGNTEIVDNKIGTFVCFTGNLTPGSSRTCTATYAVTQEDIDNGSVTNDAFAQNQTLVSPPASVTINGMQTPDLAVVKTALNTDYTNVGDILDYQYEVTNRGNTTITLPVSVSDDRIAVVNCPNLPVGGLAPNASITCTASYNVTQADIDAGSVTNLASATDGVATSPVDSATVNANQSSTLLLSKVGTTGDYSAVGDVLNYEFIITNSGTTTVTAAMSVTDDKIPSVSCPALPVGGLTPGGMLTCTGSYTVTQADIDTGSVTNIAMATSGSTNSNVDTETISAVQQPAMTIDKSSSSTSFAAAGDIVSYSYLVTNSGNTTIVDPITVSDDKIPSVNCPALPVGGLPINGTLTCTADYTVTQADVDAGFVTNIASSSSGTTTSPVDSETVSASQAPSLAIVKTALTATYRVPGDVVSYSYVVTNDGNVTITDPITVSDDRIATVNCPALPVGGLAPDASITCLADYVTTQADVNNGSVTNLATAGSGLIQSPTTSETVDANSEPSMTINKSVAGMVQAFGPLFDLTYEIEVENTGNVTLTDFQVSDDLATLLAPSTMVNTPIVSVSGIQGASSNAGYNGLTDVDLLSGTPTLDVGDSGIITIAVRIDTTEGGPAQANTAYSNASQFVEPTPSNPASIDPEDKDKDGAIDGIESCSEDRDGDGIVDCEDYDPTGYFYCEENGQILAGGGISIMGPNGANASIGSQNGIVIVEDGSNGFYQFYVTSPGTYTMTPTYPATGAPSTDRPVMAGALDVSSLMTNPGILGSGEVGSTGILADYSAPTNTPFYFEFDIEAGDPNVFMNNIPLQHCGVPELTLAKSVIGNPMSQPDGSQIVTYQFDVSNTGETQVDNIQITDDLGAVFGDTNVVVNSNQITAEPAAYTGAENPGFDGVIDINVLDGLGSLESGENLSVQIQTSLTPDNSGDFINSASVSGANPLTGVAIAGTGTATVNLTPASEVRDLMVTKAARPRTVQIGDPVLYTIEVTNNGIGNISDVSIVDNIPAGFAYIPNSATVSDATTSVQIEPTLPSANSLTWNMNSMTAAPLDFIAPGETIAVNLRLLAGPNVEFGAHENQAFAVSSTGERSAIATATVDYIPEPTFDCTPVLGRVYDDVNHNGYPDDGEPGLPGVRLVTVNGDIITTDQFGRYHIPCAAIADSEHGTNFLLKADVRTLPLGFTPTTENPRVVRATRGKFVKMNFGAAFRPKLRVDLYASDYSQGVLTTDAARRIETVIEAAQSVNRAIIVYHASESEDVTQAQAHLTMALDAIKDLAPKSLRDIALEASWDGVKTLSDNAGLEFTTTNPAAIPSERILFVSDERGGLTPDMEVKPALRGDHGSDALGGDTRDSSISFAGRSETIGEGTARPGRLQRWVGWANTQSSYAEGPEIETKVDSLDPVKRLNAQANVVATAQGRMVMAETYHNYGAFTNTLEIRLFDADRSVRGEPIAVSKVNDGYATIPVATAWPEDIVYVLRAYGKDGDFDETAPKVLIVGDPGADLTQEEWDAQSYTAFGQNSLVKSNVTVRGGAVRVYGRNINADEIGVMGQRVRVDETGKFVAEQLLPSGSQAVELWLPGADNSVNRVVRMVDVKSRDTFYVAQAEATIGTRPSNSDTFAEGRLAFYVRSRLSDRWAFTATADTGEARIEDLLKGLDDKDVSQMLRRLDPDKYYPVYGDDSTIEQDAPTSGRVYARLERDDDYLLWGNYQTNFSDTEFARVQRTLYGAKLYWDEDEATDLGDAQTTFTAYMADGGTLQGRDELQGTGGSVYYLRRGDISIGSEILRIETRDSISGLVIESRRLVYGTDYDMDFIQGRIILNQPLSSSSNDGRLFRDGSLSGNREVLVADYEYTPVLGGDDDAMIYGARATRWIGDLVKLGGTYNHSDDGGSESDLFELDATLQIAAGTYIKAEIAQTKGQGVQTFQSIDGGFTYNPMSRGGLNNDDKAMAYSVEAASDLGDILNKNGRIHAYWRKREAGFAGYAESTGQEVEQYGGGLQLDVSDDLKVTARADIIKDQNIGTNSFAEASAEYAVNDNIKVAAGLSYNDDGRANAGTSVGARAEYALNEDDKVYVFGQAAIDGDNVRTTDRAGVGAEVRLGNDLLVGAEVSGGEDGLGARVSARHQQEDGDEYYVAYDLPLNSSAASNYGTLNVGARERFNDALSVYGEERMQFNERGLNGVTHAYGVDYKPGNWKFGLSGEMGRVDDLDREAVSATIGFNDERMRAGVTSEYRQDENVLTGDKRRTWLLRTSAQYQMSDELRLQAKLNTAQSDQATSTLPLDFHDAEFTEASLAMAYRPIWDDRLNVLAKAVHLYDLSPSTQRFNGEAVNYRQKSQIYSLDASYDVMPRLTLGAKYGHRSGYVTDSRESDDFFKSSADLGVIRMDYHLTHRWDATIEGRFLSVGDGAIERTGGLGMLYRHINDNAKVGVGVSYGGIDPDYILAQEEEDFGLLINVVGKF
ncbi:MAG: DUF11 domain-containing protein [Hellea sp.]|nr:DUF11 domain-containing protein [Hellea sp.]